jgi:beta-lactamase class A
MKKKILSLVLSVCVAASFAGAGFFIWKDVREKRLALAKRKVMWKSLTFALAGRIRSFDARASVVIKDLETNWSFEYNGEQAYPSASLVKIPIMLSCYYAAQERKIGLAQTVKISRSQLTGGSGVLKNGHAGTQRTVQELIHLMITESDNTAANALIDLLGFDMCAAYFSRLGLTSTNLVRKMMDFQERKEGVENYTNAREMAYLLEVLYRGKFLSKAVSKNCLEVLAQQKVRDRIPRKLPSQLIVAHKTGLERHICHDVGIVFTPAGDFLICVLTKHNNTTARESKKFISDLSRLTYDFYQGLR